MRSDDDHPTLFLATALAVIIAIVGRSISGTNKDYLKYRGKSNVSHRLTFNEVLFYITDALKCISTLTWFQGDYKFAEVHLQKRLRIMIKKNPWLLGRITVNYIWISGNLSYEKNRTRDDASDICNFVDLSQIMEVVPPTFSPISREVPFEELGSLFQDSGLSIKNGSHEPIFKVTVLPCSKSPQERFALVVQLSHIVGDGATYYKLLHMLCSKSEDTIVELNPERIANSKQLQIETMGEGEEAFSRSVGMGMRFCRGLMECWVHRVPMVYRFGFVDASKMKKMKEHSAKEAGVPFVSTNDVITSWFMTQTGCPMATMAVNWRNRLKGHTDIHAGNYENNLFYQRADFATPALIRQSLTNYRRVVTGNERMPSWWKVGASRGAIVSNWTKFGKPIEVEGCEEEVHLPLQSSCRYFPSTMYVLVVFRAGPGKTGLAYSHGHGANLLDYAPFLDRDGIEGEMSSINF